MAEGFTALFERAQTGDRVAVDAVYRFAFHRLRRIASALLGRERAGHTLQPTALVSELFLKLNRVDLQILDEDHFFRISARAMRQVVIDYARRKRTAGIASEAIPFLLAPVQGGGSEPEDALAVKLVFAKLRSMDPKVAETVWLRCVEGLTIQELSERQHREQWRVRADYDFGIRWMANRLKCYA